MTSALEINGKKLQPIKAVLNEVSYSRDYLTRLARERKISAVSVGRQWFVELDSIKSYEESSALEAGLRKKHLSEERKKEQQVRKAVEDKKTLRIKKAKTLNARSAVVASTVLAVGLMAGVATNNLVNFNPASQTLVANTFEVPAPIQEATLLVPVEEKSDLVVASDVSPLAQEENKSTSNIRVISDNVENGVLLLPRGSVKSSPEEMFSDEVEVLTSSDGTQMVVKVDKEGRPFGEVIPFVLVPVNHTEI